MKVAKHVCISTRFFLLSYHQQVKMNKSWSMVYFLPSPLCMILWTIPWTTSIINEHAKEGVIKMRIRMLEANKVEILKFVLNTPSRISHFFPIYMFICLKLKKYINWAPKGRSSHFLTYTSNVIMDIINPLSCLSY
jgi:hypothetical protein